jgi:quercetin 2,3-dioxygenase
VFFKAGIYSLANNCIKILFLQPDSYSKRNRGISTLQNNTLYMPVRIIPKSKQGKGAFNGGQIIENKPVVPSPDSAIGPFSNLFYWAHAKAVVDSTIGLHPHQGFEICSFVLKGQIRHYDTKAKQWIPLEAGDVQIIRSGNGISHSEFMAEGSEMFQIWFDPNLNVSLQQPATYDDYRADGFTASTFSDGTTMMQLVGGDSPFSMLTPGVAVWRIEFNASKQQIPLTINQIAAVYVLEGEATVAGELARESDFVLVDQSEELSIESLAGAKVFVMTLPAALDYQTYAASKLRG